MLCLASIVRCYSLVYVDESDDGHSTEIEALSENGNTNFNPTTPDCNHL